MTSASVPATGRPVAGTSCLVQPGPKPRALFLKPPLVGMCLSVRLFALCNSLGMVMVVYQGHRSNSSALNNKLTNDARRIIALLQKLDISIYQRFSLNHPLFPEAQTQITASN